MSVPQLSSPSVPNSDRVSDTSENDDTHRDAVDPQPTPSATKTRHPTVPVLTRSRRGLIAVLFAVLVVGVGLIVVPGWNSSAGRSLSGTPESSKPVPVTAIRVGSMSGPEMSQAYAGLLIAKQESELSFERGGRVTKIHVKEGSIVRRGDALAELDQEDLDAAADRTRSELKAASAVLDELVAGPREQTIRAARARVAERRARVELAQIEANRQQKLAPKGATSRSEVDSAVFGLQASENGLRAAEALLEELNEGTRQEQIAAQRAKCEAIEASLREIEASRNDSQIRAPFDGTVSVRRIDEGVVVESGTAVVRLVSNDVEAQIGLPPSIAQTLETGDRVTVGLHGMQRDAWVDRAEPVVRRETRTRVLYLTFHSAEMSPTPSPRERIVRSDWVVGEVVEMRLRERESSAADDQFWLPRSALVRRPRGLWSVLVVTGVEGTGICERRAVEILKTDGEFVLVQGMIDRGERIVSDGLHRITAGMRVTPQLADDAVAGTSREPSR